MFPGRLFGRTLTMCPQGRSLDCTPHSLQRNMKGQGVPCKERNRSISSPRKLPPVKSSPRWETCKSLHYRTRTQISSACVSFLPSPILPTEPFVGSCYTFPHDWKKPISGNLTALLHLASRGIFLNCVSGPVAPHFKLFQSSQLCTTLLNMALPTWLASPLPTSSLQCAKPY